MARQAGTIALVTLITLLVWLFAESENVRTEQIALNVMVAAAPGSDRIVLGAGAAEMRERLTVTGRGPTNAVDRFRALGGRPITLTLGTGSLSAQAGQQSVVWERVLQEVPELRETGVTIQNVEPAQSTFEVDAIVTVEANLQVEVRGAEVAGTPRTQPDRAVVRYPARHAAVVGGAPVLTAVVATETVSRLLENRQETVPRVPLSAPGVLADLIRAGHAAIQPAEVSVSLTIRGREAQLSRPSVPVFVKMSAIDAAQYEVVVEEETRAIRDVSVRGPRELIDRISAGEITLTATLALSYEELERGLTVKGAKDVAFADLPSALTFEADSKQVRFVVRRRPTAKPE